LCFPESVRKLRKNNANEAEIPKTIIKPLNENIIFYKVLRSKKSAGYFLKLPNYPEFCKKKSIKCLSYLE